MSEPREPELPSATEVRTLQPTEVPDAAGGSPAPAAPNETRPTAAAPPGPGRTTPQAGPTPAPGAPADWPTVPGYEILSELGRGGMGVVYKARQVALKRLVALKMILAGRHSSPDQRARFRAEAEAVARLQHPNIVQIHDVGELEGRPYFSLEFVAGGSLGQKLQDGPLPPEEAAPLVETLARAVHYAHTRGVVHRDLKPANVLLVSGGVVSGEWSEGISTQHAPRTTHHALLIPKITDFGLAKQLDADAGQTRSGAVMGTPHYMAPEQAAGRARQVGPPADVYALGAILYELLTGRPPFQGDSVLEVLDQVRSREPLPPSRLQKVPRDLETICLKCLAKEPAGRYRSALLLAQDLERFGSGEPILGRRQGAVRKLWRRVYRNRVLTAAVVLALAATVAALAVTVRYQHVRRVSDLTEQIKAGLDSFDGTPEQQEQIEALVADLERREPEPAAEARARLNRRSAEWIRAAFSHPRLSPEEVAGIEASLGRLTARDPGLGRRVSGEFQARRGQLQLVLDLHAPFPDTPVFQSPGVVPEGRALVRHPPAGEKPGAPVFTRVPCVGNVELKARFEPSSWKDGTGLGLVLNAGRGKGYAFVLRRAEPAQAELLANAPRQPGGLVVSILRNGVRVREQPLPASMFTRDSVDIEAKREGDLFTFRVNDARPLQFQDLFPLGGTDSGVFGLSWPAGVRLESLQAYCQALPPASSPLERGDDLYDRGQFDQAVAEYRRQANTSLRADVRQETAYKEALCLLALHQDDAGHRILLKLAEEPGNRWPAAAALRLWVWYLRHDRMAEAEAVLVNLRFRYPFEKLAPLLPYDALDRILWESAREGVEWIDFTPKLVEQAERAVAIEDFLQRGSGFQVGARSQLVRVYWIAGRDVQALETARKAVRGYQDWLRSHPDDLQLLLEDYCWLLRSRGEGRRALEVLDGWLRAAGVDQGRNTAFGVLLLERARTHVALKEWDAAEGDLKQFFRIADRHPFAYPDVATACLIEGFLDEQRGRDAEARAAWGRGEYHAWRRAHPAEPPDLPVRQRSITGDGDNLILSALTGHLSDAEARVILTKLLYWLVDDEAVAKLIDDLGFSPSVLREMWRSPRGRELARQIAFRDVPFPRCAQEPVFLWAVETLQADALPREVSTEQRALLDQLVRDLWSAAAQGRITSLQAVGLFTAWKGNSGVFGWNGATARMYPALRGPLAYVGGHRMLRLGRKADAIPFFRTAVQDAPTGSSLRRMAQAELDRLTP